MKEQLVQVAKNILVSAVDFRPNETVCIVCDQNTHSIGEAFWQAAKEMGGDAVLCLMRAREMHGNEPPEVVAGAMKAAKVLVMPTTYALTHTKARL